MVDAEDGQTVAVEPTGAGNKAGAAHDKGPDAGARAKALAYLCFDPTTEAEAGPQILAEIKGRATGLSIEDCSSKPGNPFDDWMKLVQGKVGRCDLMIVLVGPATGSSKAVEREILMARRANLPFFGIRLAGADAADCQSIGLPANRIVPHDWDAIDRAVTQLLSEGKHHKFV